MRRVATVLTAALAALVLTGVAAAHPLGNFTTNHHAEVVISGDRAYVHYVLDLAEIPTFQARDDVAALGRVAYARRLEQEIRSGLEVAIDGRARSLTTLDRRLAFPPGSAALRTTRFELVFDAGAVVGEGQHAVDLRNGVFAGRLGWRELVIRADGGASLAESTAPSRSISDQLRAIPRIDCRAHSTCEPPARGSRRATRRGHRRSPVPRRRGPPGHRPPPRAASLVSSRSRS